MANNTVENRDLVITVLGGCVNGVFTNVPGVRVVLLDWDNINDSPMDSLSNAADPGFAATLQEMSSDTMLAYRIATANR